jgi:hydroxymethylbilane synthase
MLWGEEMSNTPILRLATRGSPLALAQAHLTRAALSAAHGWPVADLDRLCPIVTFRTTGDRIQDRPLADAGGKGLFVKEIEEALLAHEADIAVHSMKDMPAVQPSGLMLAAVLPREDTRDVLIAAEGTLFTNLRHGAKLGTSSVRRQAQALRRRPDLQIVPLRGNVETRLQKLARGEADAIMLARAGLARLKLDIPNTQLLDEFLPALCQGAVGIEIRSGDTRVRDLVAPIDDPKTHVAIACERGFLAALDGSCRTPIAGRATLSEDTLVFHGEVLTLDGKSVWTATRDIALDEHLGEDSRQAAYAAGRDAAHEIRNQAGEMLPTF